MGRAVGLEMRQLRVRGTGGNLGDALIYPIAVPAVAFLLGLFLMPETRKISIWQPAEVRAGARG